MHVPYCTREDVKSALDSKETARNDVQVDGAIGSAALSVDELCKRAHFYPWQGTRRFDWPNSQRARAWRLWLDQHSLIELTGLTSGGTSIDAADVLLYPTGGPPYNRLELDLSTSAAFNAGATHQQSIHVTGLWGVADDAAPAGQITGAVDAAVTTVSVSDGSAVGVGTLLRAGDERMVVTARRAEPSGQTLGSVMQAQAKDVTVDVANGSVFAVGEVVLLDAERMLIIDIAGNTLVVKRAWDGSVLSTHDAGVQVYASRALTVIRGAVGTTAAAHGSGTSLTRWEPPALVRELAVAEAENTLLQRTSGYARTVGAGENERESSGRGLKGLRDQVCSAYGRKARHRGV